MKTVISVDNISYSVGNKKILDNINLTVNSQDSFALIGKNGAGKTTYFSLLLDLIKPTTGSISNGEIIVDQSEDWKPYTSSFIDESFLIG